MPELLYTASFPPRTCIPASYTHTDTQWAGFTETLAQSQWGAVSQAEQRARASLLRKHCSPLGAKWKLKIDSGEKLGRKTLTVCLRMTNPIYRGLYGTINPEHEIPSMEVERGVRCLSAALAETLCVLAKNISKCS